MEGVCIVCDQMFRHGIVVKRGFLFKKKRIIFGGWNSVRRTTNVRLQNPNFLDGDDAGRRLTDDHVLVVCQSHRTGTVEMFGTGTPMSWQRNERVVICNGCHWVPFSVFHFSVPFSVC